MTTSRRRNAKHETPLRVMATSTTGSTTSEDSLRLSHKFGDGGSATTLPRYSYAVLECGAKLQRVDYRVPPVDPAGDDIDIKVTHVGLCHSDVHMRDNDW